MSEDRSIQEPKVGEHIKKLDIKGRKEYQDQRQSALRQRQNIFRIDNQNDPQVQNRYDYDDLIFKIHQQNNYGERLEKQMDLHKSAVEVNKIK